MLYLGLHSRTIWKLQLVQIAAASFYSSVSLREHCIHAPYVALSSKSCLAETQGAAFSVKYYMVWVPSVLERRLIPAATFKPTILGGGVQGEGLLTLEFAPLSHAIEPESVELHGSPQASSVLSDFYLRGWVWTASISGTVLSLTLCHYRNRSSKSKSSLTSERVVGGLASAELGDWPWQASLRQNNIHRCGATLISNTWLLSAAHCFRKANNPRIWTVTFGSLLRPSRMKRFVKAIIVHEKYRYPAHNNDIAVVKLSKGVDFTNTIHRVCLPDPSQIFPYNSDAVITGWGALSDDGPSPNVLREATVKLIDSNTCNRREVYDGVITPGMLCAGYLEGGVDACQGDSGGPLVSPDSRGMWYLVGIVSWGDECAKPNKPGVYTRVTYYRDWITSKIGL
uniref:Peptidase S1 domain-containing protein n=1 Tax=Terrapene triunguis TaxID=2587831 RepID=A0A674IVX1_9SAUR